MLRVTLVKHKHTFWLLVTAISWQVTFISLYSLYNFLGQVPSTVNIFCDLNSDEYCACIFRETRDGESQTKGTVSTDEKGVQSYKALEKKVRHE